MRALHALSLLIGLLLCGAAGAVGTERQVITDPALRAREARLLDEAVQALVPGRPGVPDLYVIGFGGDSTEDVFRNEVAHLDTLMTERFGARGRVLTLVNHSDSLIRTPRPLANLESLRAALRGVAAKMSDEDVLLLFMTMHGTPEHRLVALMPPAFTPDQSLISAAAHHRRLRHGLRVRLAGASRTRRAGGRCTGAGCRIWRWPSRPRPSASTS